MGDVEAAAAGHFMALAVQYLVAGRAAAALQLPTIPGNLLHHAIEMELKSLLVTDIGLEKLRKRKYGHNLASLWLAAAVTAIPRNWPQVATFLGSSGSCVVASE
jgi:hypothetical protein